MSLWTATPPKETQAPRMSMEKVRLIYLAAAHLFSSSRQVSGQFGHGVVRLLPAITQIPEYLVAIDRNRSHTCNTPLNRRLPVPSLAHNS